MSRMQWVGGVLGVLGAVACVSGGLGVTPMVFAQDEGLPIGLPDYPRRIRRELPELKPEQEIKVGILKLHPSFVSSIEYDDNIRLDRTDDVDDVIFTEKPGLIGEMKLGDHRVEAGYGVELLQFAKTQEENATNHLAHGLLELNANDFHLTVSDTMESSVSRLFNEANARAHLFINTVEILGRYDRPMWALEGGWTHNTIDQKTDIFNNGDYGEDILAILGGYKISPKTLLLLETDVGLVNYDHNVGRADHTYWQLFTGLRGELTPKITSTAKIGFQTRQFSDIASVEPDDADAIVADIDVLFAPSVSDVVRLGYVRTLRTSTFGSNNFYRQDKLSASYRKRFARKWLLTPRVAWQFNDYPEFGTSGGVTKQRDDHFIQLGAGLRYEIQEWLSSGVAYNFRNRNSNINPLDYENNRFTFDVTVAF